ncbi:coilin isoform X2 [Pelodiscus sinensis]|uniref:coilin isoform X2 n=1 Tax=Pelodiscus sinensis TaxID=13735 RepID=UPI003F6AE04D
MAAAAGGGGPVRLRLLFDYPPPGSPGCSLCWLLLEPSQVRLVTDLISLIRDKFGFSRRAQLSLFLEGALLPPTESARLVRDNDSLRVKLEKIVSDSCDEIGNGIIYSSRKERKKYSQKLEVEGNAKSEDDRHRRKKKKKQSPEHLSCKEEDSVNVQDTRKKSKKRKRKDVNERNDIAGGNDDSSLDESKKLKKKSEGKKDLETERKDAKQRKTRPIREKTVLEKANHNFPLNPSKSSSVKNIAAQSSKKREGISDRDSSSTSSDSEMDMKQNKSSHKPMAAMLHRDKSQLANSVIKTVVASKVTAKSTDENFPKTAISKKTKPQSSSSDSNSSIEMEEEQQQQSNDSKGKLLPKNPPVVNIMAKSPKAKTSSSESDSSDSETFVIKKPIANVGFNKSLVRSGGKQLPASNQGPAVNSSSFGRGLGRGEDNFWRGHRGRGCRAVIRGRGRGRGRGESNSFFFNYGDENQKHQQLNEEATNTSVVIQNPVEVPKRDYSVLPLLAAPPQLGEKIAFKLLELTENYTPEVSDYKEGKIISWNAENKQVELEILSSSAVVKEPGKFDLVYQSADGAEVIEYAVSQDTKRTESWDALIEPRLIIEPLPTSESTTENVKL